MARQPKEAYYLTDAEKRDLIRFIQEGKPLPEQYRFVLFEDKREVELVWNGKSREVCTTVLPFQSLEHVDEPRRERPESPQLDLFDFRGRQLKGWTNKLIWGDNQLILSSLKSGALRRQIEEAGGLKLIYIDPPFDVGADFSMDIEIGGETFHKEPNLLEQIAYRDTWGRGADSFISMIYERLILMRDLLAEEGSIYVHCDWRVNAFIRLAMNEVFGTVNFINEITWKRAHTVKGNIGQGSKYMGANTDTVFAYAKSPSYIFNNIFLPYSEDYISTFFKYAEPETGRKYRLTSMIGPGGVAKGNPTYEIMGVTRAWRYSEATMKDLISKGMIVQTSSGTERNNTSTKALVFQSNPCGMTSQESERHQIKAQITPPKNPKLCSNASSRPAATKAILSPTSSAAPAPRRRWRRSSAASGSAPT